MISFALHGNLSQLARCRDDDIHGVCVLCPPHIHCWSVWVHVLSVVSSALLYIHNRLPIFTKYMHMWMYVYSELHTFTSLSAIWYCDRWSVVSEKGTKCCCSWHRWWKNHGAQMKVRSVWLSGGLEVTNLHWHYRIAAALAVCRNRHANRVLQWLDEEWITQCVGSYCWHLGKRGREGRWGGVCSHESQSSHLPCSRHTETQHRINEDRTDSSEVDAAVCFLCFLCLFALHALIAKTL